ncbi:major type 1 subunit fimbrin (pilin) [Paraburkholderia sp. BL6665CI2N2]|uniref:fimbrial protein n=1 Tax=Paraburkholderia sp. BL6665CI2N2 TaxID=1938806 RepID=UPI0010652A57|nr:fimbrial protein [Paraburkholderia sp. BL6665CI2N2]TDY20291.1 major type 1 subunit fimbrin (pilin) [Paraburkholderia sp. BL6665CI2N2]
MKSILTALAIATGSLLGLTSIGALAADGTLTFTGQVTDTTCSINGNAPGTAADLAISLAPVAAGSLATLGAVAGTTNAGDITFNLTGCSGAATKAIVGFENGATVDQATGYLTNQAAIGGATNVEVRLLNASMQPINITNDSNNNTQQNAATITGGAATLTYFAQYYATGAATPGPFNTSIQYSMFYE